MVVAELLVSVFLLQPNFPSNFGHGYRGMKSNKRRIVVCTESSFLIDDDDLLDTCFILMRV
jgi:hypothetical protein